MPHHQPSQHIDATSSREAMSAPRPLARCSFCHLSSYVIGSATLVNILPNCHHTCHVGRHLICHISIFATLVAAGFLLSIQLVSFNLLNFYLFWFCNFHLKVSLILLLCLKKKFPLHFIFNFCLSISFFVDIQQLVVEFAEASKNCDYYFINHLHLKGLALCAYNFPGIIIYFCVVILLTRTICDLNSIYKLVLHAFVS